MQKKRIWNSERDPVFCDHVRCPHRNCAYHCSHIENLFVSHNFEHFPGTQKCPKKVADVEAVHGRKILA